MKLLRITHLLVLVSMFWIGVSFGQTPTKAGPAMANRKSPAYVIIKADDLKHWHGNIHPFWQKFVDAIKARKIKASIGLIGDSLDQGNDAYFKWIKDLHATGIIEFWNHGYDHRQWEVEGKKIQEYRGTPYEHQKKHMSQTNALAREKLGFPFRSFGAPFNATDQTTVRVLEEDGDITVWLYGDKKHAAGKCVLDRVYNVNIESPIFTPSLEKFAAGYAKHPDREYFVIQGHPTHWNGDRFTQFEKILDFLIEQKAIFVTPIEYAKLK